LENLGHFFVHKKTFLKVQIRFFQLKIWWKLSTQKQNPLMLFDMFLGFLGERQVTYHNWFLGGLRTMIIFHNWLFVDFLRSRVMMPDYVLPFLITVQHWCVWWIWWNTNLNHIWTLKGSIGYQIQWSNIEPKKALIGTPRVINVSFIHKFCHFSNKKTGKLWNF